MSSYDKVVKLACKPKAAPPKSKYLDPIIAATWSEDGAVHDVCKALSPRIREPNSIVVFKALIVLHTMIRNGATDNVLSYLSSSEVLRLQNVSAGNWEGYNAPQNLQHYSIYLDSRIRAYRDLKHDAIRVQAESNRDWRNSNSIEEESNRDHYATHDTARGKLISPGPTKPKPSMGKILRVMSVEKGLLRETKVVQRMIDALVECRFYLDDLEDGLTTTALRMLVKDLLILFQAGNEGVINVLGHYFEMSHIDANDALSIYRHFCRQTERVVEYLGVARKLQNILNVPIPNLKHAPVSLAGALQEYLDDPNFERNRIEYKTSKESLERIAKGSESSTMVKEPENESSLGKPTPSVATTAETLTSHALDVSQTNQATIDFFSAIEEEQSTMFNPQAVSPSSSYFQQQATVNPFVPLRGQQFTSQSITPQQTAAQISQVNSQQIPHLLTDPSISRHHDFPFFSQTQVTSTLPSNPYFSGILQPQPSASVIPQPQVLGPNPFRQSFMLPQPTGLNPFGMGSLKGDMAFIPSARFPSSAVSSTPMPASPISSQPRPASTPLTFHNIPPQAQPIKPHLTGSKNPFGASMMDAPPVPKAPTLTELSMGLGFGRTDSTNNSLTGTQVGEQQARRAVSFMAMDGLGGVASSLLSNPTSSVSQSQIGLTRHPLPVTPDAQNSPTVATEPAVTNTLAPNLQQFDGTPTASPSSTSTLKPHSTGLRTFKPMSSFGTMLLESLPPIPGPLSNSPGAIGSTPRSSAVPSSVILQPTSFSGPVNEDGALSVLAPQINGFEPANPFRLSTMASSKGSGESKLQS